MPHATRYFILGLLSLFPRESGLGLDITKAREGPLRRVTKAVLLSEVIASGVAIPAHRSAEARTNVNRRIVDPADHLRDCNVFRVCWRHRLHCFLCAFELTRSETVDPLRRQMTKEI